MGKAALIAVTGFIVIGAVYSLNAGRSALATDDRVADYQYETLAKNAAQVAHSRAEQTLSEQTLSESFVDKTLSGEYGGVPYTAEITWVDSDDVTIETEAIATNGQGNDIPYRILSKYKKETVLSNGIGDEAPAWFQSAFAADGNLDLGGSSESDIYADGDEADRLNANMHTNSNFTIGGNSRIKGFVTSTGTANVNGSAVVDPNYNPDGSEPIQEGVDPVDIPTFDANAILDGDETNEDYSDGGMGFDPALNAHHWESTGDVEITSTEDITNLVSLNGTREDPTILHVTGDLRISGDVTLDGYVMFVVDNSTKITGNVMMGDVAYDGRDESNIAIYTGGAADIDMSGNSTLYGQIFASGDVNLTGNMDIYGNIVTSGALYATGNSNMYYRKPSPGLTKAWPTEVPQIRLVSHNEWTGES